MDSYAVILKEDVPVDPGKYGALLAPMLGITVVEAKIAVRRGGIFAENLPEVDARRLAETLEADGIGCWCVPASALPPLRAPRRVTALETDAEGVRGAMQGPPEAPPLPWDRIGVVSIGLVLVPELQEDIAGVRKKDIAAIKRLEQEQRDLVRDRLLSVLVRIDPPHMENVPPAGAHHYFFDKLRHREAMQLKAFADLVSADGSEWWRLSLEETGFTDRTGEPDGGGIATGNYLAVPVLYEKRKDAHTERSRELLKAGNVERLAFRTIEEFNRYTRWCAWRELLRTEPELAEPSKIPAPHGNGRAPREIADAPMEGREQDERSRFRWPKRAMWAGLFLAIALAAGFRYERRGAVCMVCQKLRQDDVLRLWGRPLQENLGSWKPTGPPSPYDLIIGREHEHLYDGFGTEQAWFFGMASKFGRTPGGNASPAEVDATECGSELLRWIGNGEATLEEVKESYPRLFEKVRKISDPAERARWLELARAKPDREAPENLLKEIRK